jgi:hypothetical protein
MAGRSSLGHRKSEDVLEELKVGLAQYKQKYLNHVSRMEDVRYPKQFDCRPIGGGGGGRRRRTGRPLKRLLDG